MAQRQWPRSRLHSTSGTEPEPCGAADQRVHPTPVSNAHLRAINVGCGATPTPGWNNYDNSFMVLLSRIPFFLSLLRRAGFISPERAAFVNVVTSGTIRWAEASRLPEPSNRARAIYSSHMFEHLDRQQATDFLDEVKRVLAPGGILRLAVPDLSLLVDHYVADRDADSFVASTHLASEHPKTVLQKCRRLLVGERHHAWMYDGSSLVRLLESAGFVDVRVVPAAVTGIVDPGALDLREREHESVYVEARRS